MMSSSRRQCVLTESLSHLLLVLPSKSVALFPRPRETSQKGRALAALLNAQLPKLLNAELSVAGFQLCMDGTT